MIFLGRLEGLFRFGRRMGLREEGERVGLGKGIFWAYGLGFVFMIDYLGLFKDDV